MDMQMRFSARARIANLPNYVTAYDGVAGLNDHASHFKVRKNNSEVIALNCDLISGRRCNVLLGYDREIAKSW